MMNSARKEFHRRASLGYIYIYIHLLYIMAVFLYIVIWLMELSYQDKSDLF